MLARWVLEGEDADSDQLFELGLACVIDGVEVRLLRRIGGELIPESSTY